jgi:exoribonuclease R
VHPLPDRQSVERFNGSCAALGLDVAISVDWLEGARMEGIDGGTDDGELLLRALMSGGKVSFGALSTGGREPEGDGEQAEEIALDGPDMDRIGKAVDALNDALDLIRGQADLSTIDLLNMRLLRVLPRAVYSDRNTGHFGLRSERYCHFTSPIRRYADVLAHRSVKWVLARDGRGPPVPWDAPSEEEVASMIENLNDMSSSAEEWEREMVNVALATRTSMTPSLQGVARSARLVSLIPSTAFFLLDDGVTEGRIPLSQLSPFRLSLDPTESVLLMDPQDNMGRSTYTERAMRMAGESGGPVEFLRLGGRIRCLVRSVGLAEGRVDLSLSGRTSEQA